MAQSKFVGLARWAAASVLVGGLALGMGTANAAVRIVIANLNLPGVGFNDPTPATPIGGNTGTTVGQQRLIAFTYAANIWGAALTSPVPVVINAQFSALTCTATSATLGSAGATSIFRDFPGSTKAGTWYNYALANRLAGRYLGTSKAAQINANFNVNLGTPGCLETSSWYYGLDSNEAPGQIDFVAVLQHEMAHGLGFQTFTNGTTGAQNGGFPAIWDHFLFGSVTGKFWKDMTNAERAASAISVTGLSWNGPLINAAVPTVLRNFGNLNISGVGSGAAAGNYSAGEATYGLPLTAVLFSGEVAAITTGAADACAPLAGIDAAAVVGKIALIARGTCAFVDKVKNAQTAGAIGVIITDNVTATIPGLSANEPTITIPVVRISLAAGNAIRAVLPAVGTPSGVTAGLSTPGTQLAGADATGRILMFAPNPFQGGSSVSHFDSSASPNQLMEPAINSDLTQSVIPPKDLTLRLFQEIGW